MKIAIIGAGNIGATTAYTLVSQMELEEIVLIDIAKELAEGQALDLGHAAQALEKKTKVKSGGYEELEGAGIVINAAGYPRKPGMSRTDVLEKNKEIIEKVASKIKEKAPDAVVIQVANPSDILTYLLWKYTGFNRERVLGLGSLLDTERYHYHGGKGMVLGEHGEKMVFVEEEKEKSEIARASAAEVIKKKGCTAFAPAACIYRIVKAVAEDTGEVLPMQYVLKGEHGIEDVALGVPVKIGKKGGKIEEIEIPEEKLKKAAEKLKGLI